MMHIAKFLSSHFLGDPISTVKSGQVVLKVKDPGKSRKLNLNLSRSLNLRMMMTVVARRKSLLLLMTMLVNLQMASCDGPYTRTSRGRI